MADPTASQIPQGSLSQLQTLRDQYEQLVGYRINISDDMLAQLWNQNISDLTQFGQAVFNMDWMGNEQYFAPWATLGMTQNQFITTQSQYEVAWANLTGQQGYQFGFTNNWFFSPMAQGLSATDATTYWQQQASIQALYPWIKYGLNYQQFQQQKQQMFEYFGVAGMSDQAAASQLGYWHTNAGQNMSAAVQPTFTQVEKKAANVGVTGPGSTVR